MDLQAFMHVSNGFTLCWDGRSQSATTPVGSMCLNAVADIKPVPLDFWYLPLQHLHPRSDASQAEVWLFGVQARGRLRQRAGGG